MIRFLYICLFITWQLHCADIGMAMPIQEKEFKVYLEMPNGMQFDLPFEDFNSLIFIENSLIRELVTHNTTYQDIIIKMPSQFSGMEPIDITNFLHAVVALYGFFQEPLKIEVLQKLKTYLNAYGALSKEQIIQHLNDMARLAVFFRYESFANKINELISLLTSPLAINIILLNSKITGNETSLAIVQSLPPEHFFYNTDLLNRIKIVAYMLHYTMVYDALIRFSAVVETLERLSQLSKKRGPKSQTFLEQREELEARLSQAIAELIGVLHPSESQLKQAYDFLLQFFSKNKLSYEYKKINELKNQLNKPRT